MSNANPKNYVIHDHRVSKKHLRIYSIIYEENKTRDTQTPVLPALVYCEDLESSNGTYVNGHLIGIIGKEKVAYLLCDGDVIEIRPSWKFTFHQPTDRMIFPITAQSKDMKYFLDRYTISDRMLGCGNFGNVYLGTELSANKQVACKIIDLASAMQSLSHSSRKNISPTLGSDSRVQSSISLKQKVLLEIEILSRVSHPNIVNLIKAFCSNHTLYIFTDLAPAGDLFSYTQSHGGYLDDYNARVITLQIVYAVEYLHLMGIAHRDIKKENVLVTTTDFGGRVLLTDFGFATYINKPSGRMLSKVGTDGCVAPEVGNFREAPLGYTKAADLWSLGVLTASLLTGDLMIPREELARLSQVEVADRFLGIENNYARYQWKEMRPRALRFITRLLAADPKERLTAADAANHSWYKEPANEAKALADGIKRINRFWKQRVISSDEVLEGLPDVVLSAPTSRTKDAPGPKLRRQYPDATSSPYFGLDRHLNQKVPSRRKRLLDDLNESGSPFATFPASQQGQVAANIRAEKEKLGRTVSVDAIDLFGTSLVKTQMDLSQVCGDVENVDFDPTNLHGPSKMASVKLHTKTRIPTDLAHPRLGTTNTTVPSRSPGDHNLSGIGTKRSKKNFVRPSKMADALRNTVSGMKI